MKIVNWIDEVRKGCKQVIERDLKKVMKQMEKGNYVSGDYAGLIEEIRDNERDEALLSLIKEMILEDLGEKQK